MAKMQEGFVNINNVPTLVTTFGRWITDPPEKKENEEIILLLPANNGSTGFYRLFMRILHTKYQCPVWIVANSGHDIQPGEGAPKKILGLKEQTNQKIAFFKKYIPSTARVYLVGHSIGCHTALELLKDPDIERRVLKVCLLFPLIERLNEGQKGKNMKKFEKFEPILIFFAWLLYILPEIISVNLMRAAKVAEKDIPFILSSCNPAVLKQVLYVASHELSDIRKRDDAIIKKNIDKIRMIYEKEDGWLPTNCAEDLKRDIPKLKVEISNYKHAFYFDTSLELAEKVSKWISEEKQRYY
ncbi:lipid droplet-associated hydrolase-like [Coccinella septempunctata]|uniref:lipid droplet-associated hydrolase-like n=1 Tax=Coccinella septempunctata TaxID=41139 RepID=UPI001D0889EE|nr:lipid droplet-associated hydrolase-like [Coccinella septempunctata]